MLGMAQMHIFLRDSSILSRLTPTSFASDLQAHCPLSIRATLAFLSLHSQATEMQYCSQHHSTSARLQSHKVPHGAGPAIAAAR